MGQVHPSTIRTSTQMIIVAPNDKKVGGVQLSADQSTASSFPQKKRKVRELANYRPTKIQSTRLKIKGKNAVHPAPPVQLPFQDPLLCLVKMPESHQVLYQSFALLSRGKKLISLEDLSAFEEHFHPGSVADYFDLRESVHRATNSYEISWEVFLRVMGADESTVNTNQMDNFVGQSELPHLENSLDMRNQVEERNKYYGIYNAKQLRSFTAHKSPKLADQHKSNPMKCHKSLNHINTTAERDFEAMKEVFRMFDWENHEVLTDKNVSRVMSAVGMTPSTKELRSLFKMIGKDSSRDALELKDFMRLYDMCQVGPRKHAPMPLLKNHPHSVPLPQRRSKVHDANRHWGLLSTFNLVRMKI